MVTSEEVQEESLRVSAELEAKASNHSLEGVMSSSLRAHATIAASLGEGEGEEEEEEGQEGEEGEEDVVVKGGEGEDEGDDPIECSVTGAWRSEREEEGGGGGCLAIPTNSREDMSPLIHRGVGLRPSTATA